MKTRTTRAIVLRRTNYGEADRILHLLTPEGRSNVIARGVRKEKSKLAGGIELFAISDVVIGEGRGELGILTSARLVKFYDHIMTDYDRLQFAYMAIKEIGRVSEMVDEPEWYDILSETLMGLDVISIPLEFTESWFYLHLSDVLGNALNLSLDVNGEKLEEAGVYRYDIAEQGFRPSSSGDITGDHIKLLRLLATRPLHIVAQVGGVEALVGVCLSVARAHASLE